MTGHKLGTGKDYEQGQIFSFRTGREISREDAMPPRQEGVGENYDVDHDGGGLNILQNIREAMPKSKKGKVALGAGLAAVTLALGRWAGGADTHPTTRQADQVLIQEQQALQTQEAQQHNQH